MVKSQEEFQKIINYNFKNIQILNNALTHSSYSNECKNKECDAFALSNERMEFLGDSILSFITSVYLYKGKRDLFEGDLTKIRAGVVCENALFEYANELNLGEFLYLGKGEQNSGGRNRKSILADAFEALIAAIYLDGGLEKAEKFVIPFIENAARRLIKSGSTEDFKTLLQKFVQHNKDDFLEYVVINEFGPSHDRTFEVQVLLNGNSIGYGEGNSKREAEQLAAKQALQLFGETKG